MCTTKGYRTILTGMDQEDLYCSTPPALAQLRLTTIAITAQRATPKAGDWCTAAPNVYEERALPGIYSKCRKGKRTMRITPASKMLKLRRNSRNKGSTEVRSPPRTHVQF